MLKVDLTHLICTEDFSFIIMHWNFARGSIVFTVPPMALLMCKYIYLLTLSHMIVEKMIDNGGNLNR